MTTQPPHSENPATDEQIQHLVESADQSESGVFSTAVYMLAARIAVLKAENERLHKDYLKAAAERDDLILKHEDCL